MPCEINLMRYGTNWPTNGFCGTAAGEFICVKRALGFTEAEARRELATCAPHTPSAPPPRCGRQGATALRCSAGV